MKNKAFLYTSIVAILGTGYLINHQPVHSQGKMTMTTSSTVIIGPGKLQQIDENHTINTESFENPDSLEVLMKFEDEIVIKCRANKGEWINTSYSDKKIKIERSITPGDAMRDICNAAYLSTQGLRVKIVGPDEINSTSNSSQFY